MSIVLLCGALYGVMRMAMLCSIPANRLANCLLAALIAVFALYTAPYIIGYAGYYDAYPWLSFAPYNLTLAIGPLLYAYLTLACGGSLPLPRRLSLYLLPALLQWCYYSYVFAHPTGFKDAWDASVHRPYVEPLETLALLASLTAYLLLAWRVWRRSATRPEWGRNLLLAAGLTGVFWLMLAGAGLAWSGLDYFQRFPFYLWLAILICYLGNEGYRHGVTPFPKPRLQPEAGSRPAPDLAAQAGQWHAVISEEKWWRDPELTVATLARRLGTNTSTLSRTLNDGLGLNFNEVMNRLRVEAVVRALSQHDQRPVLDIAMAEGFNSKASFNRAFKLYTGETPTAYRRRVDPDAPVSISS